MTLSDDTPPPNTGPLSWRDVYRELGNSEARILAAIRESMADLKKDSLDHEVRLRSIELHGSGTAVADAQRASQRLDALERDSVKREAESISRMPVYNRLQTDVEGLLQARTTQVGKSTARGELAGYVKQGVTIIISLLAVSAALYAILPPRA